MKKIVITISRSYGSGGRELGEKVAQALKIDFYDKALIEMMCDETGLDESVFEQKKPQRIFHFTRLGEMAKLSLNSRIYSLQSDLIKKLAEKSCVIVGRCSDYILKDDQDAIHIYVYANMEDRIKRCINEYHDNEKNIETYIEEVDEVRSNYYEYFTDRIRGDMNNYDLCINNSKIGIDAAAKMIVDFIKNEKNK